jgi:S-disulfanyl-L-cysteine oxidoreductase SoxD
MSNWVKGLASAALVVAISVPVFSYKGVGSPATPAEVAAWNIDVRPDFQGLPKGSGSVAQGQVIWDNKCASCHGTFGESNEVFTPLAGGTTKDDQRTGHVAVLANNNTPQRTTLMKLATVSTLWDYIHRAMPWNAPKSLSVNDTYAVTAYVLNLNDMVPDNFVLNQESIRAVQAKMPNRNGMTQAHGLWLTSGKGDTHNIACMSGCKASLLVTSQLPDYARNASGNLMEQNRPFGAVRGVNTALLSAAPAAAPAAPAEPSAKSLAENNNCLACHGINTKIVGPAFKDVAKRYADKPDAAAMLMAKIKAGGQGAWGNVPMPAQDQLTPEQAKTLANWVLAGAQ